VRARRRLTRWTHVGIVVFLLLAAQMAVSFGIGWYAELGNYNIGANQGMVVAFWDDHDSGIHINRWKTPGYPYEWLPFLIGSDTFFGVVVPLWLFLLAVGIPTIIGWRRSRKPRMRNRVRSFDASARARIRRWGELIRCPPSSNHVTSPTRHC
jgi:hypothetical protein